MTCSTSLQLLRPARVFAMAVFLLAATTSVSQQPHMGQHAVSPIPQEILDRPVKLRSGIGRVHQKVSTSSFEAQSFYDQGLSYLHSFVWIEAIRSFRQALRLDPKLGMAYVELADAFIGLQEVAEARQSCAAAAGLRKYMTAHEQAWLTIRERELDSLEKPGDQEADMGYKKAIADAIRDNHADPWLWMQRGLAAEASPFTHGQAGGKEPLSYYKTALALDPNNLAALHYVIHSEENLGQVKDALARCVNYVRLAPAIPHAHHMHGHELMRVGRTEQAIEEFRKTKALEDEYSRTENIPEQYDWQYSHNLQLLALNYELLGQVNEAEGLLRESFALPASTEFLDYNRRAWPEFLINRGRFGDALNAARELSNSHWPMARLAGHALAGEALLSLNRMDDAKAELTLAEQESKTLPLPVASALPYPAILAGAILLREGKTEQGEANIVNAEKALLKMGGPDAWITTLFCLESIARDARDADDWELARFTAEQMIEHDPYYAGGHFAIGLVAEHAGEAAGARQMFAAAEKLWAHADINLPERALVCKKVAGLQ